MIVKTTSGISIDLSERVLSIPDLKRELGSSENATMQISVDNADGELTEFTIELINGHLSFNNFSGAIVTVDGNDTELKITAEAN
jgi:hypothetical protein